MKLTVPQLRLLERLAARKGDPWETLDHVDRRVAMRLACDYGLVDVRVGSIAKITDRGREALARAQSSKDVCSCGASTCPDRSAFLAGQDGKR